MPGEFALSTGQDRASRRDRRAPYRRLDSIAEWRCCREFPGLPSRTRRLGGQWRHRGVDDADRRRGGPHDFRRRSRAGTDSRLRAIPCSDRRWLAGMGWRCAPLPRHHFGDIYQSARPVFGRRARGGRNIQAQPRPSAREISLGGRIFALVRWNIIGMECSRGRSYSLRSLLASDPCRRRWRRCERPWALIFANLELGSAYLIPIDDDKYDKTNLNRCLLAGWQDVDQPKVDAIARALRAAGIEVFPFNGTIRSYVTNARIGLRFDVAQRVDDLNFDVVASCVDKGISRQDIQGLEPHLLFGGSTLDLQAKANWYTGRLGSACLACFNPAERNGEKVRALESQLRTMPAGERGRFLTQRGLDAQAMNEYLAGARCGGLGESALKDYATQLPPEFSTSFVSLGAGLLLAAALLRGTVFSGSAPSRRDMCTLNFRNGGFCRCRSRRGPRMRVELSAQTACSGWPNNRRRSLSTDNSTRLRLNSDTSTDSGALERNC